MEIDDVPLQTVASDGDYLLLKDPQTKITYRITKADFLAGLSSSGSSASSVNLSFASDGDANGLFYYLGTGKRTKAWENPYNTGVLLSASTIGAGSLSYLCDRQEGQFYTNNDTNGSITINVSPTKLKCNYYSLRNRNASDYYLRSWKLQGSNDNATWVDLDTQTNNTTLNSPSQWLSIPINSTTAFSFFRLLETGVDSMGYHFICLGEIELYGVCS